jgi:double zinc ribbon protein
MFCTKCGASLAGRTNFCGRCGAPIPRVAQPVSGAKPMSRKPAQLTKCRVCDQPVAKSANTCPHCGVKTPAPTSYRVAMIGAVAIMLMIGSCVTCLMNVPPEAPPFYQPGPPVDLITMLSRGDTSQEPFLGTEVLAYSAERLCKVIVTDYTQATYTELPFVSTYKYESTQGDSDLQGLVTSEASLLVTEVSSEFTDKKTGEHLTRKEAEAVLHDEARLYGNNQQDPVDACLHVMPGLAQYAAKAS